ncbi:hypothetical protein BFJ63_vAg17237 [Fusarium oxysporum f. sp. narcissi]|uniref:Uncharacterized protein n=1 Tax=Fusarium oxysporum f. sp. narcissi TaxID=451672 RepID=A0A4Q2V4Q3_FUSOX|nr:hypothetical protein BFJ63_vAg17237 [Fusarium oxysporum f. sp. narcissi]
MRYGVKKEANRPMRTFVTILITAIITAIITAAPTLQPEPHVRTWE